jgi:hypothetical protein
MVHVLLKGLPLFEECKELFENCLTHLFSQLPIVADLLVGSVPHGFTHLHHAGLTLSAHVREVLGLDF